MTEHPSGTEGFPACRCNTCGKVQLMHRLGCSCGTDPFGPQDLSYGEINDDGEFVEWPLKNGYYVNPRYNGKIPEQSNE